MAKVSTERCYNNFQRDVCARFLPSKYDTDYSQGEEVYALCSTISTHTTTIHTFEHQLGQETDIVVSAITGFFLLLFGNIYQARFIRVKHKTCSKALIL